MSHSSWHGGLRRGGAEPRQAREGDGDPDESVDHAPASFDGRRAQASARSLSFERASRPSGLRPRLRETGRGCQIISHDLNLVASFCDRVLIMYAGRIVETCRASALHEARHPYTRGLLASLPRVDRPVDELAVLPRDPAWLAEPAS